MRRQTDSIKYKVLSSNFLFVKEYQFKSFINQAFLRKNIVVSNVSFFNYNNISIINLDLLYRTKRLLYYRKKVKFRTILALKNKRKIKNVLQKYAIRYLKKLKRLKNKIKKKKKKKEIFKKFKRIYKRCNLKGKFYFISKKIIKKIGKQKSSFRFINLNSKLSKSYITTINNKFLITKNFGLATNDLKIRIYPLNFLIKYSDLAYFYKKLRFFQRNIFIRGQALFLDIIKATTLLIREAITLKSYIYLLGIAFENIHKNKHNVYLRFIQTLFNVIAVYIKRLKKKDRLYSNILGIKLKINGKLKGKDRAKVVRYLRGNLYNTTVSAKIHFARYHAHTKYGVFGLSMWVSYKPLNKLNYVKKTLAKQIYNNLYSYKVLITKKQNIKIKRKLIFLIKKNLKRFYRYLKIKKLKYILNKQKKIIFFKKKIDILQKKANKNVKLFFLNLLLKNLLSKINNPTKDKKLLLSQILNLFIVTKESDFLKKQVINFQDVNKQYNNKYTNPNNKQYNNKYINPNNKQYNNKYINPNNKQYNNKYTNPNNKQDNNKYINPNNKQYNNKYTNPNNKQDNNKQYNNKYTNPNSKQDNNKYTNPNNKQYNNKYTNPNNKYEKKPNN